VNVVELTGNHILNWDLPAFEYTLQMYRANNIKYFGGGENLTEARQPLLIENNGNKLAFIGCNPAGPDIAWATDSRAGGASCDYDWMKNQIAQLRQEGYLPIATLQYPESYDIKPGFDQIRDFNALSDAGAVIVSGSQAHFPQGMTFLKNGFVHYGLGNLFFDQMHDPYNLGTLFFKDFEAPIAGVRIEVIDRHVFYDGKYLGVELLTAVLEDFSQPRPMTAQERTSFLHTLFKASGWDVP
jgi:poly-gamma-glutamate capsule biosynthesis protein CapA/YwtB (metallophosphatase superfamily)